MLDYLITIAISAFFVPHYLGPFLDFLADGPGDVIGGVVVVAALAAVNVRGLGRAAGINSGLALLDIATQIVIIGLGTILVLSPELLVDQVKLGEAPTWSQLVFAVSISMVAYTGIETIANMAQEERDPGRDLPRAANGVVVAVIGLYIGITVIALSALPVTEQPDGDFTTQLGTTYQDDPILGIVSALDLGWLEPIARGYVGVLAATILLVASNAGLIGISRLSWSLAEHHQLPGAFASLFGRGRTPAVAIVFLRRARDRADPARRGDLPRQPVQLRRAAVVHDRPRVAGRAPLPGAGPRAAVPRAVERAPARPVRVHDRAPRRGRDVRGLGIARRPSRPRAVRRARLDDRRAGRLT